MSYRRIAVFGGGNAAFAVAADLTLMGCEVTLCDFPEFEANIAPVADAHGTIHLTGCHRVGATRVARVTTDLRDALSGVDLVLAACQAAAHGPLAQRAAPYLRGGQTVILCPGSCFGAYEFARTLAEHGGDPDVKVAETNTFVFAARRTPVPNEVRIKHVATEVFLAALPVGDTEAVCEDFRALYPSVVAAQDTLETCLLNLNPYVHAVPALLNVGRVEYSRGEFYLYREGITPSVTRVMAALDAERVTACRALGYRDMTVQEIFHRAGYIATLTDDAVADYQSTDVLREAKGPFDVRYRYYTEDIGYGIAAVASLGRELGLPMPLHEAVLAFASTIHGVDHAATCSRTVSNLGLGGLSAEELRLHFTRGIEAPHARPVPAPVAAMGG